MAPATPGAITVSGGGAKVCPGDVRTYTVSNVLCVTYAWTPPTGATVTSGQGSNAVVVTYNAGFTANGTLSVTGTNSCGTSAAKTLAIARNAPATPGYIYGPATEVCPGTQQFHGVTNVSGITYNWYGSTASISILNGQGSNYVNTYFDPSFTSGTLYVTGSNACGTSAARSYAIKSVPSVPGAITVTGGAAKVCPGDSRTYTVATVAGVTWTWTPPTGATINSGQGSTSVSVTFDAGFTANGYLSVTANNACGSSVAKTLLISRNIVATVSNITGPTYGQCGTTGVSYSVSPIAGISTFYWTISAGSFSGASASNTVTVDFPGSYSSSKISVSAVNACGTGTYKMLTVYPKPYTPASISGPTSLCSNSTGNAYSTPQDLTASTYTWTGPTGSHVSDGVTTSALNILTTTAYAVTVDYGTLVSTSKLMVKGNNACGSGAAKSLTVGGCGGGAKMDPSEETIDAETSSLTEMTVYPNPSEGLFNISFVNANDAENVLIRVFDLQGKLVKETNQEIVKGDNYIALDLSKEMKGVYFMDVQSKDVSKRIRLLRL